MADVAVRSWRRSILGGTVSTTLTAEEEDGEQDEGDGNYDRGNDNVSYPIAVAVEGYSRQLECDKSGGKVDSPAGGGWCSC